MLFCQQAGMPDDVAKRVKTGAKRKTVDGKTLAAVNVKEASGFFFVAGTAFVCPVQVLFRLFLYYFLTFCCVFSFHSHHVTGRTMHLFGRR